MSKRIKTYSLDIETEKAFGKKVEKESTKRGKDEPKYSKSSVVERFMELYTKHGEKLLK